MIGIGQHSYSPATWQPNAGGKFNNALTFLEYANSIGASGVQVAIKPDEQPNAAKIRARCDELNAYFEGNVVIPKSDGEVEAFDSHIAAIKTAGGTIARTACLSGRRYETFKSLEEFNDFKAISIKALTRAERIVRKHKIKLAVENHKDWLAEEHVAILRGLSSEWIGALIDTGNNIALLENPYEHIEALAPFAFSSHLKDMAVQEYEHGFLLSEVPLASGYLDIPKIVSLLRKANPQIRLNLEMITRDPLKIPCLDQKYYATFENRTAAPLAQTIRNVKSHPAAALPQTTGLTAPERIALEDRYVRESITWANGKLRS
jgi:3-oxoisoapionate decarboxylase